MFSRSKSCVSWPVSRIALSNHRSTIGRSMATVRAPLSHEERTAQEHRESQLEPVRLSRIEAINSTIRLLRLSTTDKNHIIKVIHRKPPGTKHPNTLGPADKRLSIVKFRPGQWLDVFIPGVPKAGGFTITSTPKDGIPTSERSAYLELAIQQSTNPPAKWFWRPESEILGAPIVVRAGGSFVWPPPSLDTANIDQVVLVAGGVGINPLISIFSHLMQLPQRPRSVRFVYATKVESGRIDASRVLFLTRLLDLVRDGGNGHVSLDLFLTGTSQDEMDNAKGLPPNARLGRIGKQDLEHALGSDQNVRARTVCYVCGPPVMTDEFVGFLSTRDGMEADRVLCEKWW